MSLIVHVRFDYPKISHFNDLSFISNLRANIAIKVVVNFGEFLKNNEQIQTQGSLELLPNMETKCIFSGISKDTQEE